MEIDKMNINNKKIETLKKLIFILIAYFYSSKKLTLSNKYVSLFFGLLTSFETG